MQAFCSDGSKNLIYLTFGMLLREHSEERDEHTMNMKDIIFDEKGKCLMLQILISFLKSQSAEADTLRGQKP
jgi:hypothetical protein